MIASLKDYPVLRRLVSFQILTVLVGGSLLLAVFLFITSLQKSTMFTTSLQRMEPHLRAREEQWRLWKALSQDDVLSEEIHEFESQHLGWKLKVLPLSSFSGAADAIILPLDWETQSYDYIVVAEGDRAQIEQPFKLSGSIFLLFIGISIVFVAILLVSARYIHKNFHRPFKRFLGQFGKKTQPEGQSLSSIGAEGEIKQFLDELLRLHNEAKQSVADLEAVKIARQVAHDIRSPVSALEMLIFSQGSIPEDARAIAQSSISRIKGIANDLLKKKASSLVVDSQRITSSLSEIVAEKRAGLSRKDCIQIELILEVDEPVLVDLEIFKRLLSNLLDNSLDAIKDKGWVRILLSKKDTHQMAITIEDSGCGIDVDLLSQLGQQGFSAGKDRKEIMGGLGLFHAREALSAWGGELRISSKKGVGTKVEVLLPCR